MQIQDHVGNATEAWGVGMWSSDLLEHYFLGMKMGTWKKACHNDRQTMRHDSYAKTVRDKQLHKLISPCASPILYVQSPSHNAAHSIIASDGACGCKTQCMMLVKAVLFQVLCQIAPCDD